MKEKSIYFCWKLNKIEKPDKIAKSVISLKKIQFFLTHLLLHIVGWPCFFIIIKKLSWLVC